MKVLYKELSILEGKVADISGYGRSRTKTSECLDDPKCCIVSFLFEEKTHVLISLDTVAVSEEFTSFLKKDISQLGISQENVDIIATHTHSGPGLTYFPDDLMDQESSIMNQELTESLSKRITQILEYSKREYQEVECYLGTTTIKGCYGNRNEMNGAADKDFYILQCRSTKNNKTIVTIANFSCHSTILKADTLMFSGDLASSVRMEISKQYHCPCLLTVGAAGDVSTRFFVKEHDYQSVKDTARKIVRQIESMTFEKLSSKEVKTTKCVMEEFYDPNLDQELISRTKQCIGTNMEFMVPILQKRINKNAFPISLKAKIVELNDLFLVYFPGELVTSFGNKIRNSVNKRVILICYANDYWQYFVPEEEYGKYFETANSILPKGMADRFVDRIIDGFKK